MYRKTEIQLVNKRLNSETEISERYLRKLPKIIRFSKTFFANMHFRLRGQNAYCCVHTDKVDYTLSGAVW